MDTNPSLSSSFLFKVLSPIMVGTKVVGTGLSNVYNANLLDYAIEKHLKRVESSKSSARDIQIAKTKKLLKELRRTVNEICSKA